MISSTYLLATVKRAVSVPASQPLLKDSDILEMADEKIKSRMVPLLESFDTNFFVRQDAVDIVGGQRFYDIPYRAVGRGLRELKLDDGNGNIRNMPLIALEDEYSFINTTNVAGFYFEGDRIKLVPDVPLNTSAKRLIITWRLAPSRLMVVGDAGVISNIAYNVAGFDEVTLASTPAFATAGTKIDFVKKQSGCSILDFDKTIQSVVGNLLRFTAGDVPTNLSIGDYVCPQEQTPVINSIPDECIGLLKSHVTQSICEAIGDFDAANRIAQINIPAEEKDIKSLLSPRIDGEPVVVINRQSLVRGNKFSQRRWIGPP